MSVMFCLLTADNNCGGFDLGHRGTFHLTTTPWIAGVWRKAIILYPAREIFTVIKPSIHISALIQSFAREARKEYIQIWKRPPMQDPLDRGRSGAGSCRLNKQEAIGPWKHPFCASVWSMASLMNDLPPSSARAALVVIVISRICKAPSVDGHPATLHWSVHGFWASSEWRTLLENYCGLATDESFLSIFILFYFSLQRMIFLSKFAITA